ncbi:hypothetical protein V1527DRAFT_450292 [Lipomyces starkeyi]
MTADWWWKGGTGHFYLCVPVAVEVVDSPAEVPRVVELGKGDIGGIHRLCHHLDVLHSRLLTKGLDHANKLRVLRAAARIRRRIRTLVDDLHKRAAKYSTGSRNAFSTKARDTRAMLCWSARRTRARHAELRACVRPGHQRGEEHPVEILQQAGKRGVGDRLRSSVFPGLREYVSGC